MSFPLEFSSPLGLARGSCWPGCRWGSSRFISSSCRRRPVQVPSTLLWRKSLEDLHVNSLFQRLRRNLLLFLQLLAVALAMLALAGLRMKGTGGQGQRFVLMIDNSASMAATDVAPSRLAKAKEAAKKVVEAWMPTTWRWSSRFGESAQVVSNYTGDKRALAAADRRDRSRASRPRRSAKRSRWPPGWPIPPSRSARGWWPPRVVTPKLFIYTDGGFADVEGFSLGNLEPEVVVIGPPPRPYSPPPTASAPAPDAKAKARKPVRQRGHRRPSDPTQ